ncbi:MAG: PfkB family carbohydrate kinase [Candidatus Poribacteria bacterium]|nr:PfkB family carbohydrate kinase [Candidatus Poribacteria bacterium]
MISEARLKTILNKFHQQRILVIGDFYLDAYWHIDKTQSTLSLETPWHTNPVITQRYSPGAAGTVTNNLKALGVGNVYTLGVIGEDGFGGTLLNCLEANGCLTDFMVQVPGWVTPTYLKPIHRGYEGVETEGPRFDIENQSPMVEDVETAVIEALKACLPLVDGIIVGDQMPHENLGVITNRVREALCKLAVAFPEKIFFADSRTRIGAYRNVIIKPNRFEAKRAVQPEWRGHEVDIRAAKECAIALAEQTQNTVYITLGENGVLVYCEGKFTHIPGIPVDSEIDPVGAGDSVSAGLVASLCSLRPSQGEAAAIEATYVGNLVASITVTKIGTTGTASPAEILERHRNCINL